MKTQIPREPFLGALQVAASVVIGARGDRQTLQDVKVVAGETGVRLYATDYELGLRLSVPGAEVHEAGTVVVGAARLLAVLRELDSPTLDLSSEGTNLEIRAPGARYTIHTAPAEEFPEVPEPDLEGAVTLPREDLRGMIRRTQYAAATEKSRYALHGVRWEARKGRLRLVATDGRRLALVEKKGIGGGTGGLTGAIVPLKAMAVLEKILGEDPAQSVAAKVLENRIVIGTERALLTALLLEGQYPEYEAVIPAAGNAPVKGKAGVLLRGVRQAAPLADVASRAIRLRLRPGGALLKARSAGAGGGEAEVEIPLAYEGPEISAAFNPDYLADALRAAGEAEVTLDMTGTATAAAIREGEGNVAVIMPVTLAAEEGEGA
ncbi:MAG: DNA polymerase III subunit beta [Planctomycetales bacterium]|nr:DNA polymerase III subunit beta [Planctomycetales bacterium]